MTKTKRDSYHHGDLRSALISAAEEIIAAEGVEGFTLRKAARKAGVSPGAPTHHFGSMAGLLTQVARRSYEALGKQLAGAAEGLEGNAALRALTAVYVRFARDNTGRFRLMGRTDLIELEDDDLRAAVYRAMRPLADAAAGTRGLGVPTPEFERLDPRLIAAIAPAHGLAHLATEGRLAATMRSGEVDAQAQDALVDEVLRALWP